MSEAEILTIKNDKLPGQPLYYRPGKGFRGLAAKMNLLIVVLLLGAPGMAFSISTVSIESDDLASSEAGPATASFSIVRTDDGNLVDLTLKDLERVLYFGDP